MGVRIREIVLLLAVCALALGGTTNKPSKKHNKLKDDNYIYDEDYDAADDQEVLFNEDRPCPRDCICTVSQGYRIAKCNRLEVGTQKFGDDITDLVIENSRFPIQLDDLIFKKLGLHQIATVKIVNSTIKSVGPDAFHGLHELYAVNLSNNKLKSLHPETFATNKKLLLLTLANNPLKFPAQGSGEHFLNAPSVQELDVSYCNIQYITANTFKNMTGLMYLNIAGNDLSNLDRDTFKHLPDLEELDLSDNNIKSLPDDIFSENSELATLHIQKNPIDTVYGLQVSDLLTLNAGQTNIRFIGPSMFNGMPYIANLNLSSNNIEKIHNQAFHKLVELNYLDLSYNDLDMVSSILIKENIELDIFKISNNPRLKHLPEEGFNCSAESFNIYLFDASYCGLEEIHDNSLRTFTALSQINLAGNRITAVSNKVFSHCPKLVEINLSFNGLMTLDIKIFEKNKDLGKLYLQGNPLKVLPVKAFTPTPLLTWLDLSHCELTSLGKMDKTQPKLLSNLSFLNVSHNRITEIKPSEVENLTKLRTIDIRYNPLACSRDFEDLMTWLSSHKVSSNANPANIANLAKVGKDEEKMYSWESLSKKICGTALPKSHPVDPLPAVSDEEIWERIDKDAEGNFDLKATLDDGKIPEQSKIIDRKIENMNDEDGGEDDDEGDDTDDEDGDDDEDDDDASEDYDDSDEVELKVKESDNPAINAKKPKVTNAANNLPEDEKVSIKVTLKENEEYDFDKDMYLLAAREEDGGRYDYLWPILFVILATTVLLAAIAKIVSIVCTKRRIQRDGYNPAIIAALNHASRTKKDCGLVYQQLSEDVKSPATPKLSRYAPLHTIIVKANSYESAPYQHKDVEPEAV